MHNQKERPLLHIGYGRTATTWFQEHFYTQVININYYDSKKIQTSINSHWRKLKNPENVLQKLDNSNNRLVICDESMLGRFDNASERVALLKDIFYPSNIIIFIRNQEDKFLSGYNQYIRGGGTSKIRHYLFNESRKDFWKKHDYNKMLNLYKGAFGKDHVHVYLYEEFESNFEDFIKSFCKKYKLQIEVKLSNSIRPNSSFNRNILNMRRLCNHLTRVYPGGYELSKDGKFFIHIPYWFQITNWLFNNVGKLFKKNRPLTMQDFIGKELTQEIRDYYAQSNRLLIKKHGLPKIQEYNYPGCTVS